MPKDCRVLVSQAARFDQRAPIVCFAVGTREVQRKFLVDLGALCAASAYARRELASSGSEIAIVTCEKLLDKNPEDFNIYLNYLYGHKLATIQDPSVPRSASHNDDDPEDATLTRLAEIGTILEDQKFQAVIRDSVAAKAAAKAAVQVYTLPGSDKHDTFLSNGLPNLPPIPFKKPLQGTSVNSFKPIETDTDDGLLPICGNGDTLRRRRVNSASSTAQVGDV